MSDTSVPKVSSRYSPRGALGQKYLASGIHVVMRLWEDEAPAAPKPEARRDYETVGFVVKGRTAVEATTPPVSAHGRDDETTG